MDGGGQGRLIVHVYGYVEPAASAKLVTALVNDIIMPLISLVLPGGDWKTYALQIGTSVSGAPVSLMIGDFAGALIDFIIIALVVFLLVKYAVKDEAK
jgi:large conductance mechanosensitive channel